MHGAKKNRSAFNDYADLLIRFACRMPPFKCSCLPCNYLQHLATRRKSVFLNHISNNLCKGAKINDLHRFHPAFAD